MRHVTTFSRGSWRAAAVLVLALAIAQPASSAAEGPHQVEWAHGRLSVVATEAPLAELLAEVARLTGIDVEGLDELRSEVSVNFSGVPLAEGLRRLLAGVNHLVLEESVEGTFHPVLVSVFSGAAAGSSTARPRVPHGSSADVPADRQIVTWLSDREPGLRRWAVEQLAQRAHAEGLPWLVHSLTDADPGVRQAALAGLGQHGEAGLRAVETLLRDEPDPEVRVAALHFLGQVGRGKATEVLRGFLQDHDARVRIAAVEALGLTGSPDVAAALIEATRDREPAVRRAALRTLALYAPHGVTAEVVSRGLADTAESVREVAGSLSGGGPRTDPREGR